jgi:protoporphyrinogen oxidase
MGLIAVVGSGMAALGASYRLRQEGAPHVLFDMNDHLGGHTASHADPTGFVFDEGPHISFTKDTRIQKLLEENVKGEFELFRARVNNYWKGVWIKHPAQCNLHGLPTDFLVKILMDMIEARYKPASQAPTNYAEWLIASFGRTFAQHFPMEYGRKYHTTEAANMSLDWLGPRLYQPALEEVLAGALAPDTPDVHYISEFRYPSRGGFQSFVEPFTRGVDLRLGHEVVRVDERQRVLTFANGKTKKYDALISSMPLPELVRVLTHAPREVQAAAARLACSTCVVVNVGVDRRDLSDWHWTYFYDADFCFSRVSFPHMFSPHNAPDGMGSIQVEVYYSDKYKPLDCTLEECTARVIADLMRCGLLRDSDTIVCKNALLVRYANVIFDLERASALAIVREYLDTAGIRACGRYGDWAYHWTDESFKSGESAAQRVLDSMTTAAAPSAS